MKQPGFWMLLFLATVRPALCQEGPPFYNPESERWADSVMATLSYEEKLGQLFMVSARSDSAAKPELLEQLIRDFHIGGVMFLKGTPSRQASLINRYQQLSKVKLLVAMDAEWGLSMRLDSTTRFPRQMTLGAMRNDTLIYAMGREIARQCRRIGIHVNFAPVVDINNNAANPVINSRSFGEDKLAVSRKGWLYMKGLQDGGVLACAKHFPGHGNTDTDSHEALPVINQSAIEMDTMELVPFRYLMQAGLGSVMVAHLFIPALDTTTDQASTLSAAVVDSLLIKNMGFKGLVFTDALNMKGVSGFFSPGTIESKALQAGNDVLLFSDSVPLAVEQVHYAVQNCELDQLDIDARVRKILMAKHWCGVGEHTGIEPGALTEELNTPGAQALASRLYRESITVLKNDRDVIPLVDLSDNRLASLVVNDSINNVFQMALSRYAPVARFRTGMVIAPAVIDSLVTVLERFDLVILSIHNTTTRANLDFGLTPSMNDLIGRLRKRTRVICCLFGNAYCLAKLSESISCDALVLSYEDTYQPALETAQVLFGARNASGVLPVTPVPSFPAGSGLKVESDPIRLAMSNPEEAGFRSKDFLRVDSIVRQAILARAMPGCQVLAARDGKIIYSRSFGHYSYDSLQSVTPESLYDIASVTKIAATALAAMKLYEEGELKLNHRISKYLSEFKRTDKADLKLREIMAHQAGLQAWIPFYKNTLEKGKPSYNTYHPQPDVNFPDRVADSLYIRKGYSRTLVGEIVKSPLGKVGEYVYSDLGLLILQQVIEKITEQGLDEYVTNTFYKPLGLDRVLFNPLDRYSKAEIAPTEWDTVFRHQLVHGDVHDQAAAMLHGVGGHAGVFSNASGLAVIMQMLMNGGTYGGRRYLKEETIHTFTAKAFPESGNRRGLLFDRPSGTPNGPTCDSASAATYGHQGFTGTCAWADPQKKLVYIFLSNRIHPSASNHKLVEMNVRTNIMQAFYDAMERPGP